MALTQFTSYDEVRSALGVSIDEIGDSELGLPLYELSLKVELEGIAIGLPAAYLAAADRPSNQRTEEEERLVTATRLFSTYAVASQLTTSLPLFSPKEMSDNKALMVRYSTDPYKAVIAGVKANLEKYRGYLDSVYASISAVSRAPTRRTYLSVVSSTSGDPVTGS